MQQHRPSSLRGSWETRRGEQGRRRGEDWGSAPAASACSPEAPEGRCGGSGRRLGVTWREPRGARRRRRPRKYHRCTRRRALDRSAARDPPAASRRKQRYGVTSVSRSLTLALPGCPLQHLLPTAVLLLRGSKSNGDRSPDLGMPFRALSPRTDADPRRRRPIPMHGTPSSRLASRTPWQPARSMISPQESLRSRARAPRI